MANALGWSAATTLTLAAASNININAAITAASGGLTISAGNTRTVTATAAIDVGAFILASGRWTQNSTALPGFSARDFRITDGASFLRVTGGDGTSGNAYQLADVYGLQGIGSSSAYRSAYWTLANDIDAAGTATWNNGAGFQPIGDVGNTFSGDFNGQSHTISGLTINRPSTDFVALFGNISYATLANFGLVGGSITGQNNVGALAGQTYGTITNVYATSSVKGIGQVGGLVGLNLTSGTITDAYATGTVNGSTIVGGLVGYNYGGTSITNAYATGAVNGGAGSSMGGLVGQNDGTITNAYATGAVKGGNTVGGLVGYAFNGSISNSYATGAVSGNSVVGGLVAWNNGSSVTNSFWDTQSTGISYGYTYNSGTFSATGRTTAQFQDGASTAALGGAFTISPGLNPYLTSFYPTVAQAISGYAYLDAGVTRAASGASGAKYVYVDIAGTKTAVTTGANGYYYAMVAGGTLSSAGGGTATLAYTLNGNAVSGATLTTASATTTGLDVWGNTFIAPTSATRLSAASATASALIAGNTALLAAAAGSDAVPTSTALGGLGSVGYIATDAGGFTVDQGISPYGLYVQSTQGPITVSAAQTLGGPVNLSLLSAGALTITAPIQVNGAGAVHLAHDASSSDNLSFGLTGTGFAGSLTYANADGSAAASDQGGSLSINNENYRLLYSMADVESVNNELSGNYALATNLDASGITYSTGVIAGGGSTGSWPTGFSGVFEGLGHTIDSLTIDGGSNYYVGLIGRSSGARVRDIGITGGAVSGYSHTGGLVGYADQFSAISDAYATGAVSGSFLFTGGLVGYADQFSTISNAYATGAVSGEINVGGLVGYARSGTISNAYATGAVSGGSSTGGLVGTASDSTISNAYATGVVSGGSSTGGLVGTAASSTIGNAYATGAVSGDTYTGGLVGQAYSSTISNAYASGAVSGDTYTGGLVGYARSSTISNAYATGAVSGDSYTGGLMGYAFSATISNAYATGAVSGDSYAGGLVGDAFSGTISNAYATGAVSGASYTGGLMGYAFSATISNVYATGAVSGANYIGGLVGYNEFGTISHAYWDIDTSGQSNAFGFEYNSQSATGLTTAQMKDPFSFLNAGWDFSSDWGKSTSGANSGYMMLRALSTGLYDDYIAIGSATRTYGDANTTISGATLSGLGTGNVSLIWGSAVGATANAGAYSYADADVVSVIETGARTAYVDTSNALTINQRALTVTADARSRTYGDANPALTYTANGLVNGDTLSGSLSTAAGQSSNVGLYAIDQGTLDNSNYAIAYTSANLTINQRALTVTANAMTKAYGDANPSLTYVTSGLVNGDTLSGSLSTAAGQYSNVGLYGIGQGTLDNSNYAIAYSRANLTINQRALTVTADGLTKTYGDTNPVLTYGASGLVNGDRLSGSLSTAAGQYSNVGTYAIDQGTISASSNYTLTYVGADLTINQRALTVTADTKSKIYGDANPALTYVASGLVNGDTLSGSLSTAAGQYSNVGNYAIGQGTLDNSNYSIVYSGADLTINQRALTVAADAATKTYGDANPVMTYTAGGLVNGDTLSGSLSTAAGQYSNVGNYAIGQGTLDNSNYSIAYSSADLTINKRALTVAADAVTKTYGDTNPALTYVASGLVNGDTLSGSLSTAAGQYSNVGNYAIGQGSLDNSNYSIAYSGADLTINQRVLTVTADALTKTYGDTNPALTYVASGLVNGDTLSGSLSTSAGQYSNVGNYAIDQGSLDNSNYSIAYSSADLTINQRALTVAADAVTKTYGDTNPALTYVASGLVNGDTLSGSLSTAAGQYSNVGNYAIGQGSLDNSNYSIAYSGADLSINQRALTVTADAVTKTYGDTNPALTYGASGLVNGDTLSGSLSTAAGQYSNVGLYGITQGSIAASANYALTYVGADLTVTQRALTVTANDLSRYYGTANPALTYSASGLVNGDRLSGSLDTAATRLSDAGAYAITRGTLMATSNYGLSFNPGILTVKMLLSPPAGTQGSQILNAGKRGPRLLPPPGGGSGQPGVSGGSGTPVSDPRNDATVVCDSSGACVAVAETN